MTEIAVINQLEDLTKLEDSWTDLGARFPTPMVQHEWFLSCAETLHHLSELHIVIMRDGGRIIAIAPLAKVRRRYGVWLEIIGGSRLHEPTDLLYESETALNKLTQALVTKGYPLDLSRLPIRSPLLRGATARAGRHGAWIQRPSASSCRLSLDHGWESLWQCMSRSRRTDFRRIGRRAKDQGGFHVDVIVPKPERVEELLKRAMEIEASSWKRNSGNCLANDFLLQDFFTRYCKRMAKKQALYIFFLNLGKRTVAMHVAVGYSEALWILKIGYDEQLRQLSPGLYLAMETVRYAAGAGFSRYEFLGAEEKWQHIWPVERQAYLSGIFFPWSIHAVGGALDIVTARMGRYI